MSVRSEKTVAMNPTDAMNAAITEAQPADSALAEHAAFSTNNAENPLHRSVVVSVRASLNELCLQKQKGVWAPSAEAMRSIMQVPFLPFSLFTVILFHTLVHLHHAH